MNILFDIGNTYVKVGFLKENKITFRSVNKKDAVKEIKSFIKNLNGEDLKAYIVSVNEDMLRKVEEILSSLDISYKVFSKSDIKFETRYEEDTLGHDRIVTDYGAYKLYGGKIIVIDLGTAATFDLIDENGIHLGGAIMPGKETYQYSLLKKAKILPKSEMLKGLNPVGTTTLKNLNAGLYYGFIGSVVYMINVYKSQDKYKDYKVVLTGGDTELFAGYDCIDIFDKELTLKSLNSIYERVDYK